MTRLEAAGGPAPQNLGVSLSRTVVSSISAWKPSPHQKEMDVSQSQPFP